MVPPFGLHVVSPFGLQVVPPFGYCLAWWFGGFRGCGSVCVVVVGIVSCGGVMVCLVLEVSVRWFWEVSQW